MFDISEGGASGLSWTFPVKGMDTTDFVIGGVNGSTNQPLFTLTLRTRNLHERLAVVEQLFLNDSDTIINNLKDILDAFQGETEQVSLISLLAKKSCNVSTTADKASWVTALEIAKRTYNLNSTEKGTWVTGLGVDTKAGKTFDLSTTAEKNSWLAGLDIAGELQAFYQQLDNNEFTAIVQAFSNIYTNPSNTTSLSMGGGVSTFNLDVAKWKNTLGIGKQVIRNGSTYIGDISTDKLVQCFFPAIPSGTSYFVVGSLLGVTSGTNGWDDDNDVMWITRDKTSSSFKIAIREAAANTQNLWFEWALIQA